MQIGRSRAACSRWRGSTKLDHAFEPPFLKLISYRPDGARSHRRDPNQDLGSLSPRRSVTAQKRQCPGSAWAHSHCRQRQTTIRHDVSSRDRFVRALPRAFTPRLARMPHAPDNASQRMINKRSGLPACFACEAPTSFKAARGGSIDNQTSLRQVG
jgi:hypothetical protein